MKVQAVKWNPHSLTLITPNPTPSLTTQLTLVYNTYVYPQREEEKDSRMAGFKLFVFDREAHFIGPQESGCSTIGRSQKAVWILAHCEDANSKLVEVVTVAHVDEEDHVGNS